MENQMEMDLRLDSEKELDENIAILKTVAFQQLMNSNPSTVNSRHEGYGFLMEHYCSVQGCVKGVKSGMDRYTAALSSDDVNAMDIAVMIEQAITDVITAAVRMAAEAKRVAEDLYEANKLLKTPLEEMTENDEWYEAESSSEAETQDQEAVETEAEEPETEETTEELKEDE